MGGGSARYTGPASDDQRRQALEAQERERERLKGDINVFLAERLASYNERDTDLTQRRLDEVYGSVADVVELETILFGGSVAKQTAVQGLSDVDALAILKDPDLAERRPGEVLDLLYDTIRSELPQGEVQEIAKGALAVTIRYLDGSEVQLLPAVRRGEEVDISSARGTRWVSTDPKAFREKLTDANQRAGQALVPAIKLVKAMVAQLPEQKRVSGYHAEALAIDAMQGYAGPNTPRALVLRILSHASNRVLRPMADVTGQSRSVDEYLGAAESLERRNVAQTLHWLGRRLESATSVEQWASALGFDAE